MQNLTSESFRQKIFDYEENQEWAYLGSKPAIIDFYADWCGPCRALSPILEELDKEYKGLIDFYKVDTEAELELTQIFGIHSIPTTLFVPVDGDPQIAVGAYSKEVYEKAIEDIFNIKKPLITP
ncbi:MAG: thioredoxin domain-containing protein [Ignavibacteria bacterium]|nr:thioredoxin domain-containing protein [Ignavibacteria bacterium]